MLSELKEVKEAVITNPDLSHGLGRKSANAQKLCDFFLEKLKDNIDVINGDRFHKKFHFEKEGSTFTVEVKGIMEDFSIYIDGRVVCEQVYDNYYHCNDELIDFILT